MIAKEKTLETDNSQISSLTPDIISKFFEEDESGKDEIDILSEIYGEGYEARQDNELSILHKIEEGVLTEKDLRDSIEKAIVELSDNELQEYVKINLSFLTEENVVSILEKQKKNSFSSIIKTKNFLNYDEYNDLKSLAINTQFMSSQEFDSYGVLNCMFPFEDEKPHVIKIFSSFLKNYSDNLEILRKISLSRKIPISCYTELLKNAPKDKKNHIFEYILESRSIVYKGTKNNLMGWFYDSNEDYLNDCIVLVEFVSSDDDIDELLKEKFFSSIVISDLTDFSIEELWLNINSSTLSASQERVLFLEKLKIKKEHIALVLEFNEDFGDGVLLSGSKDLILESLKSFEKLGAKYQSSFDVLDYFSFISIIQNDESLLGDPRFYIAMNSHLEFRDKFCENKFYDPSLVSPSKLSTEKFEYALQSRRILFSNFINLENRPEVPRLEREFSKIIEEIENQKNYSKFREEQNYRRNSIIALIVFIYIFYI